MEMLLSGRLRPTKYPERAKDAHSKNSIAWRWRVCLSLSLLYSLNVSGQFIYFDKLYGVEPTGENAQGIWGNSLFELEDGYFFASITMNQSLLSGLFLVRTNLNGETVWDVTHTNDTVSETYNSMVSTSGGNYVVASSATMLNLPSNDGQAALTGISSTGEILWHQFYGIDSLGEIGQNLITTSDYGFSLIGQRTIEPQNDADIYLVRTDSGGNLLWENQYGGDNFEGGRSLIETPDLGFLLLGWTRSFGAGQRDFYLVKTDSLGNQEWQRTYGGSGEDVGWNIIALNDGNYLLCGGSQVNGKIIKVTPDGTTMWQKNYQHPNSSNGNFIFRAIELESGNIAAVGATSNVFEGDAGWLIHTDANGNLQWQRKYNYGNDTDLFYTLIATSDGGFLLGGQAIYGQPITQDAWLLKVDSVGCTYADCLVGVDELNSSKIVADVWPNPANQFINIGWEKQGSAEITLLDMTGKEVLRQQSNNQREIVDVSGLPSGLYVLQLVQGEVLSSLRVLVQH